MSTEQPSQNSDKALKLPIVYVDKNLKLTLRSQDIYIIRQGEEKATLIEYENYAPDLPDSSDATVIVDTDKAITLEWFSNKDSYHHFFTTPNGYYPVNLTGPVLTKVIDWNLDTANYPPGVDRSMLKPGYLLDLRFLQLNRVHALQLDIPVEVPESEYDTPIGYIKGINASQLDSLPHPSSKSYDGHVPLEYLCQLKELNEENLYIVSWKNPLLVRDINKFYPYQITYLSADKLDNIDKSKQYEFDSSQKEIDLDEIKLLSLLNISNLMEEFFDPSTSDENKEIAKTKLNNNHRKAKTITEQSLARYYRDAGVQIGAVNPKDLRVNFGLVGLACMVANLQSFLK